MGFSQRLELRQSAGAGDDAAAAAGDQDAAAVQSRTGRIRRCRDRAEPAARARRGASRTSAAGYRGRAPRGNARAGAARGRVAGDFTADAAEHWQAAAGAEGDGTGRSRRRRRALTADSRRRRHPTATICPAIDQAAARPRTLREHLLEQIGADLPDPGDRVIALQLLDLARRGRLLSGELDGVARAARLRRRRGSRRCSTRLQRVRPAGRLRPQSRGVPGLAAARAQPARSGDAGAARQSAAAGARATSPALLRLCGVDAEDLADMIAEIKSLDPRPGLAFDADARAAGRARHPDARAARAAAGSSSSTRTPCRACWSTTATTRGSAGADAQQGRARISGRAAARRPTGWSNRCISAPPRSSRSRPRSCASRTASSATACSACGR